MKRIKAMNGYTIYQMTARDEKQGNGTAGEFSIYFSSDIRDYGVAYSTPEYEGIDSLEVAIEMISDSDSKAFAQAKEELEEVTTAVSFEDIEARAEEIKAEAQEGETMNETTNTTTNTNAQEGKAMFEELTKEFLQDIESERAKTAFYVINGYFATWAEEHRNDPDRGIKAYSTDLRWSQYTRGEITREKAIELATKRMNKEFDKRKDAGLAKIQQAENAPDINEIFVNIDWVRSSTWGMNPHAYAETRNARTYGTASGCGYDKESSAIAQAFNADWSILRILYTLKEQGLREGKTDESKTACTGHDNRDIIGYGAGYSVLPYFEGGVGSSCFWAILRKAGFEVHGSHGKKFDGYTLTR